MASLSNPLLGIGLTAGVGLSIGGYYLFKSSPSKTFSEKLKKDGVEILDYSATPTKPLHKIIWDDKLSEYKSSGNTNAFNDLEISDANLIKLKEKCKEHLSVDPGEISKIPGLEEIVKKWCTITVSQED